MLKKIIKRPSFLKFLVEPGRAILEASVSAPMQTLLSKEEGDGHPVFVLPGFMASEKSTSSLRKYISNSGYSVYDWGMGRNLGKMEYLEILYERIDEIYEQTGEKISLVGWSLGGIYARQIAKERPHLIRQVITLGSPFAGLSEPNNASWIYTLMNKGKKVKNINQTLLDNLPLHAPVPTTAIFSKSDGIVSWQVCLESIESDIHQNIEVRSSHLGLGSNFSVLKLISNRLKFDSSNWEKFKPDNLLEGKLLYPSH